VAASARAAREGGHDQVGSAHVVLGLLDEGEGLAAQAIEALDVPLATVRDALRATLGPTADEVPEHIPFAPDAKRVRDLTVREALRLGHDYVGTEHILLGVLSDADGQAAQVLSRHGVTKERAEAWIVAVLYGMRRRSARPPSG
jgi:ATP-dependent Clp protease ATP-binding subunit ClpA